jgi:hypothetical protein
MGALRLQAVMATDPREGIKAVEALGVYGNDALPKLVSLSDAASLANKYVRQAANSEIEKIKKGLKP